MARVFGVMASSTRLGIDVVRALVGFDRDDDGADPGHGQPCGDVRVRRNDDLVAGPDPERAQRQFDGVEAVADADAMRWPRRRSRTHARRLRLPAQDEPAARQHPVDRIRQEPGRNSSVAAARSRNGTFMLRHHADELIVIPDVVQLVVVLGSEHETDRPEEKFVRSRQTIGGSRVRSRSD